MNRISLPDVVMDVCRAHEALKEHFSATGVTFTLDGKLVGDIGEAIAAQMFGLTLCERRIPGVDAHAPDGRSVQIKATGRDKAGPAFTLGQGVADHLLFLRLDFNSGTAELLYNGPEKLVRDLLPTSWTGTKVLRLT